MPLRVAGGYRAPGGSVGEMTGGAAGRESMGRGLVLVTGDLVDGIRGVWGEGGGVSSARPLIVSEGAESGFGVPLTGDMVIQRDSDQRIPIRFKLFLGAGSGSSEPELVFRLRSRVKGAAKTHCLVRSIFSDARAGSRYAAVDLQYLMHFRRRRKEKEASEPDCRLVCSHFRAFRLSDANQNFITLGTRIIPTLSQRGASRQSHQESRIWCPQWTSRDGLCMVMHHDDYRKPCTDPRTTD